MSIGARISYRIKRGRSVWARKSAKFAGHKLWSKQINGVGKVKIRFASTDELTFDQVFVNKEYDISRFKQHERLLETYHTLLAAERLPIIIDAGANVGAASIWFSTQFPGARILAVEPDPENAAMCRVNTEKLTRVKVIESAIGSEPGRVSLLNPMNEAWMVRTVREEGGHIVVRTIPALVAEEGESATLFIVKIDIEGFERDLFKSNTEWMDDAAAIFIEPHDWLFPDEGNSLNLQRAVIRRRFQIIIRGENLVFLPLPA